MTKIKNLSILLSLTLIMIFTSCEKETIIKYEVIHDTIIVTETDSSFDYNEGFATIRGTVKQANWAKDFAFPLNTTNAQNEDVFLVYEDNSFVEKTWTLQNGSFVFSKLLKGNYTVLVYSEDINKGIENIARTKTVLIESNNDNINIGTFYINKENK